MKIGLFIGLALVSSMFFRLGDLGEPRSSYDMGSARMLEGRQVIVNMYVDTLDSLWNDEKINSTLEPLKEACSYLEAAGMSYDKDIEFIYDWKENPDLKYRTRISIDAESGSDYDTYADKYISLFLKHTVDYDRLLKKYEADGIFMIINFNVPGRSYAICYDGIDNPKETLIMYNNNSIPSVYAHEILHLYGAHDYYLEAEYTEDVVSYIKKKYPNDIMLTTKKGKKITNTIGPLTAYHLGWAENAEGVDEYPQLNKYEQ